MRAALIKWWHGTGAFLDYSNPGALAWWQAQEAAVLALGVDGWKLDGSECDQREEESDLGVMGAFRIPCFAVPCTPHPAPL